MTSGHVWASGKMVGYELQDHRALGARPPILVVIPYFNAAPWIEECLARLEASLEPHDILIVDDGSEPALSITAGPNIVLCRFQRNCGLISALNFAAEFALMNGYRYYVRQDADDFSHVDRLRLQRERIEQGGADLVVCGVRAVDERGRTIWKGAPPGNERDFKRILAMRNPTVHSTWFMRTDIFQRIGCYDERFKGAEDFEFLQRIARAGRIDVMPNVLVDYLVRSGSILSGSRQPALQTLRIVADHFDFKSPASYLGLGRAFAAASISRGIKTRMRRLWRRAGP